MLGLFVFGRDVEGVYGKREFFRLYLSLIVMAGLFDQVVHLASGGGSPVIGALGGVMGVAVIFACHFPRRKMLVFPIPFPFPRPCWSVSMPSMNFGQRKIKEA